jgi:hypothetical protein
LVMASQLPRPESMTAKLNFDWRGQLSISAPTEKR